MRHLIALLVMLAVLSSLHAQDTAAAWIARLGSPNYVEREKAARKLEELGRAALPLLHQLASTADLETKRRAAVLIDRIEQRLIYDELTTATPTRYRFDNLAVDAALREIEKQSGLRLGEGSKNRIKVTAGPLPFWRAWQQVCQAARLEESDFAQSAAKLMPVREAGLNDLAEMLSHRDFDLVPTYNAPRLEFAKAPARTSYAVDDRHSIRVRVRAIESTLHEKVPHTLVAIELRAEPRLDIVSMPKVEITRIVDETGKPRDVQAAKMLPAIAAQLPTIDFLSAFIGEVQYGGLLHLRLIPTPDSPRMFKELHGNVQVDVMVRPRIMEWPNVLGAAGKELRGKAGITVKVLEAEKTDEDEVHLRLHLNDLDSLTPKTMEQKVIRIRPGLIAERGAVDVALDRLQLLDRTGRVCPRTSARYHQAKNGKGFEAEVSFNVDGRETADLVLLLTEEPRKFAVRLPFLVRDVVLPAMKIEK